VWTRTLHCHLCSPAINARTVVHAIIEDVSILPRVSYCRLVTFDTHTRKRVYAHRACCTPRTQSTCIHSLGTVCQPSTTNTLTANERYALLTSSQTTYYHFAKFTAIDMRKSQLLLLPSPYFRYACAAAAFGIACEAGDRPPKCLRSERCGPCAEPHAILRRRIIDLGGRRTVCD
jgi:hypothetical protein